MTDLPLIPQNPYRPDLNDDVALAPFAGRQRAFEHLYQHLTDPAGAGVSVILGRRDIGKSALLRHFNSYFDDTFIGVYIGLKDRAIRSEADWLEILALDTLQALGQRDFSLYRLPRPSRENGDMRKWLSEEYLADTFRIVRGRRLVWLIDDAGALIQWVRTEKLPDDHFEYLNGLVTQFRDLGMVLALDSRYETDIAALSPLARITDVYRLGNLTAAETTQLMQQPVADQYHVSEEVAAAVHAATAGQPRLLQRIGARLYNQWETRPTLNTLTPEDVKNVAVVLRHDSNTDFQRFWDATARNGRLVLAAVSRLLVQDPLTPIDTRAISAWLIESDYPLDMTAIHAAIRSLEYDEVVENSKQGIRISSGLMQTWLLEHAELQAASSAPAAPSRRWFSLAAAAALVVLIVLLAFIVSQQPQFAAAEAPPPTLTLVSAP
ncbi:MAG: hypothetical protein R3E39_18665 [Anaerolineae bacterium]